MLCWKGQFYTDLSHSGIIPNCPDLWTLTNSLGLGTSAIYLLPHPLGTFPNNSGTQGLRCSWRFEGETHTHTKFLHRFHSRKTHFGSSSSATSCFVSVDAESPKIPKHVRQFVNVGTMVSFQLTDVSYCRWSGSVLSLWSSSIFSETTGQIW